MMGSRYRLNSGLALLAVNQSTAVMNATIDQDSISSRVRVRPGKKRRAAKCDDGRREGGQRHRAGQG